MFELCVFLQVILLVLFGIFLWSSFDTFKGGDK
jgi:hypothetical protein